MLFHVWKDASSHWFHQKSYKFIHQQPKSTLSEMEISDYQTFLK